MVRDNSQLNRTLPKNTFSVIVGMLKVLRISFMFLGPFNRHDCLHFQWYLTEGSDTFPNSYPWGWASSSPLKIPAQRLLTLVATWLLGFCCQSSPVSCALWTVCSQSELEPSEEAGGPHNELITGWVLESESTAGRQVNPLKCWGTRDKWPFITERQATGHSWEEGWRHSHVVLMWEEGALVQRGPTWKRVKAF